MRVTRKSLLFAAAFGGLVGAGAAIAQIPGALSGVASTVFVTNGGDIAFPFTPPNVSTGANGTIQKMTITASGSTPINCDTTPCALTGLSAAQGGEIDVKGGASSTSANAGGAAKLVGGAPGATGIGGAANVVGAAGGATSGAGGAASVTGGVGTAGNAAGGAGSTVGGAGQGSAAGGAAALTGGVGGATGAGGASAVTGGAGGATSGTGGVATVTGGAGSGGNANGGDVTISGGAANGSGVNGVVRELGVRFTQQGAPTAATTSATLTAANVLTGIITVNQGAAGASAQQLPAATAMDTALPSSVAGDAFDFSVINISTVAAEAASLTTNAGWTLVGDMDIIANSASTTKSAGRFRARKTGTGTWVLYRLS